MAQSNGDLTELKNLGKTWIHLLRAVGINSREDLDRRGPVGAYRAIQDRGFTVSRVLLYSLYGALSDRPWTSLAPEVKAELVAKAETDLPH